MVKNYFTIAWRQLLRHPFFSAINILCLAIGITFSLIIGLYVLNQYTINASIRNVNSQYILKSNWAVKEMGLDITTLEPLARTLREEYPSLVAGYYRYNPVTNVVSAGDKFFKEDIAIGDTGFISMYDFPVLYGNKQQPFTDNNSAVITETMAMKLFDTRNAVNRVISILTTHDNEKQDYKVSAVIKDLPNNSVTHIIDANYQVFVPSTGNRYFSREGSKENWNNSFQISFVELKPGISPRDIAAPLRQLLVKYTPENIQKNLRIDLVPVRHYHLQDNNAAAWKMIMTLGLAALFILLMAIINFVNINIGTSSYRLKEIGLRKVFGGARSQLIRQFITEAMILTVIATLISLAAYSLLRPVFDQVLHTKLQPVSGFGIQAILYLFVLVLVTGFIAGLYPALVLSSSRVINAVKGKIDNARGGLALRKSMLVIQFTLAIIVFICALTVSRQVSYVFSKDKGYDKDQVLVITAFPKQWDSVGVAKMNGIMKGLLQDPAVSDASLSFEIPDRQPPNSVDMQAVNGDGKTVLVRSCGTDEHYAATFGMKVLSGTCFAQTGGFIPNQVVLNESAVKALGLTIPNAVNRQIRIPSDHGTLLTVAGVVKDFNYSSLQEKIEPLAFFHVRDWVAYRYISLKLKSGHMAETVNRIKNKWKELSPGAPFEYNFMDEKFRSLYQSELQLKQAMGIATVLNLIIVFLGIFGIVSFTLVKRTKEIAVRKVLGAGIRNIILLFIKDYAWLILVANIIAWPLAYMITGSWLQNYAYRIQQNLYPYLAVCVFLFITAFSMIAVQCLKAGLANPVKSLRTE